jgi:uncharacterized protein involved in exopolysaccharide biosynthesis
MGISATIEQEIEYWLHLLLRRQTIVTRVFLAVLGLVTIASLLWPPTFESTGKVLVQANPSQLLVVSPAIESGTQSSQPTVLTSPVAQEDLNSETELLSSRYLMERTVEQLGNPDEKAGMTQRVADSVGAILDLPQSGYNLIHALANPTDKQSAVIKLSRKLEVNVIKRSNIIEVSFASHDGRRAQAFLTRFLDEYLELHAHISQDPAAELVFLKQAEVLNERLHISEESLRNAQMQTGINDLEAQRSAAVTQLYNLEGEESKANADLAAAQKQAEFIEKQMATTPQRQMKESQIVQNMALQTIKPQVLQLETQRAELLNRYQPTSQKIRDIDAQLAAARKILSRENATEVRQNTTDINPTWATLDAALAQARYQAASEQASQQALLKQIDGFRNQLNKLSSDGLTVQRLQRQVDVDKEAYLSYLRKGEEARAAQALNQKKILKVSIVQPPTYPIRPIFPNVPLNTAAGIVLGLIFGVAAAYWQENSDETLYSPAAVSEVSGLPVAAVIMERN